MPSCYLPKLTIKDKSARIEGEEFHHLYHVFRKKTDDEIMLTSGNGILARAKITSIEKRSMTANIITSEEIIKSNSIVAAAFSLLKNKHDHLIVEKLTELGVKEFFPIICEHTIRKNSDNILDKLTKVAISAIKQCDNAFLPRINPVMTLEKFIVGIEEKDYELIIALETGEDRLLSDILIENGKRNICFLIGPEGGFSPEEIRFIKEKEIKTFTLGNHVLRAETAAITTTAQIIGNYLQQDPGFY